MLFILDILQDTCCVRTGQWVTQQGVCWLRWLSEAGEVLIEWPVFLQQHTGADWALAVLLNIATIAHCSFVCS